MVTYTVIFENLNLRNFYIGMKAKNVNLYGPLGGVTVVPHFEIASGWYKRGDLHVRLTTGHVINLSASHRRTEKLFARQQVQHLLTQKR